MKRRRKNPRGDAAVRGASRGRGGDPRVEAWRRGQVVLPDVAVLQGPEWNWWWQAQWGPVIMVVRPQGFSGQPAAVETWVDTGAQDHSEKIASGPYQSYFSRTHQPDWTAPQLQQLAQQAYAAAPAIRSAHGDRDEARRWSNPGRAERARGAARGQPDLLSAAQLLARVLASGAPVASLPGYEPPEEPDLAEFEALGQLPIEGEYSSWVRLPGARLRMDLEGGPQPHALVRVEGGVGRSYWATGAVAVPLEHSYSSAAEAATAWADPRVLAAAYEVLTVNLPQFAARSPDILQGRPS